MLSNSDNVYYEIKNRLKIKLHLLIATEKYY